MAVTFAEREHRGASGYFVTIADAVHDNVTGDGAYVVVPAGRQTDGWRVAAWAWTKGKQ